jgi:hypothetical protein
MKTTLALLLGALGPLTAAAQATNPAAASAPIPPLDGLLHISSTNGFSLRLDPKVIANSGAVGLDYEIKYDRPFGDHGIARSGFGVVASSRGLVATESGASQDSIISELRLDGHLFLAHDHLSPLQQARVAELLEQYGDDPFAMPPRVAREYDDLLHRAPARFAKLDAHVKHEADQNFDHCQLAVGAGFASDLNLLTGNNFPARLFDAPFAMTRSPERNATYASRPPRFYVGYDYVDAAQNGLRAATTTKDHLNRLTFQAAWSTLAFDNIECKASFQAGFEVAADAAVRAAGKEWTSFVELSAAIPVDASRKKKIFVKYTNGELPPTLREASNVALGFSLELGEADRQFRKE